MRHTSLVQVGVLLFVLGCGTGGNAVEPADAGLDASVDASGSATAANRDASSSASEAGSTAGTGPRGSASNTSVGPLPTAEQPDAGLGKDASPPDSEAPQSSAGRDASPGASHEASDTSTPVGRDTGVNPPLDAALDSGTSISDGGSTAATQVPIVTCRIQAALDEGTCEVTAGDAARLITGVILRPDDVLVGGEVLVDANGVITCSSCDCSDAPGAATATQVSCPTGVVSPGLINAHEHLTFDQLAGPLLDTGERYDSRSEWRTGAGEHPRLTVPGGANQNQLRWTELRFLFGGATSVVGSGGIGGVLRNLDRAGGTEGLSDTAVDFDSFPLDDSNGTRRSGSCTYGSNPTTQEDFAGAEAYIAEVAAGDDAYAHNEFLCTAGLGGAGVGNDLLTSRTSFVHAMALSASDYALMANRGSSLVWTPRSDIAQYGNTAGILQATRLGLRIALGTEWLATGSMNLLRELQCADAFNHTYLGDALSDYQLWQMVTWNAARVTGFGDSIGALLPGRVGDVTIFDGHTHQQHRAVISAQSQDVVLVMRGGKALYGDAGLIAAIPGTETCEALSVCDADKLVCLEGELPSGQTYLTLSTAMNAIYPALVCGTPTGEPTCVPSRPESVNDSTVYAGGQTHADADGDGILDAEDNCPNVFNPIRPMDDGVQADADADGAGDACDVCPLSVAAACESSNPDDGDSDGILDWNDNCPDIANAQQSDTDADNKGDACDFCPSVANLGVAACPVSIYDIKSGTLAAGTAVALSSALVTAKHPQGFFVQVKDTDGDYQGVEYSGLFIALPDSAVAVGDRVAIATARVTDFFGERELSSVVGLSVLSSGEALPDPVLAISEDVATGGVAAAELEGVLVQVDDVVVTDINPAAGTSDSLPTHEFVVEGLLRINDYFYLASPFPNNGQRFDSIAGILRYANGNSRLEPRQASDLNVALGLTAFTPAHSFARVGDPEGPSFPVPLGIVLSKAAVANTQVSLTSNDGALGVPSVVTILAGQTTTIVPLTANAAALDVTITATLDGVELHAAVQVLDATSVPSSVELTPGTQHLVPGAAAQFTVQLDIPAPAGGTSVALALNPVNAGAVPQTVLVAANQLTATFNYVDAQVVSSASITATLGTSNSQASILLP